jgi:hypothetical protein
MAQTDWTGLADDAVHCEPVSAPNSLLAGKKTGNFAEFGPLPRFLRPITAQIQSLVQKFPTHENREFSNLLQGRFLNEQGNFLPRAGKVSYGQCLLLE